MSSIESSLLPLLLCPNCGTALSAGTALECAGCETRHFWLGDVPCLFPAGEQHKAIWQHQAGVMQANGEQGLAQIQESLSRYDLSDASRHRLTQIHQASTASQKAVLELLEQYGMSARFNEAFNHFQHGDLTEYFDLILRDWAWDDAAPEENRETLARIMAVLAGRNHPQRILVLGAGAGRLSWDLHQALRPALTVAFDSNPVLLAVADSLVRQQRALELAEFKLFPQVDRPAAEHWILAPPDDADNLRANWFALGGDVWRAPLRPGSFDLVVTPWFIDVNGGDVRDLIGIISHLLAPGGSWLNHGPLLFTRHLPLQMKYGAQEIREFLALAGFALETERLDEGDHLVSPLEVRRQHEQLWTFAARYTGICKSVAGAAAPWLVMHHLPIPAAAYRSRQQHPLIDAILGMVDGERSINQISFAVAPHLPEGVSPKDIVVTLFGQILAEMGPELSESVPGPSAAD